MSGDVEVYETFVGGKDPSSVGRSKGSKRLVVVGIERSGRGVYKAYAREIRSVGVKKLKPFFADHISKEAEIKTGGLEVLKKFKKKL